MTLLKRTKRAWLHTALFDGAVVKLGFGVAGVAPGPVLVPIWIATVVLRQIGLRMRPWVYPEKSHGSFSGTKPLINVTNTGGGHTFPLVSGAFCTLTPKTKPRFRAACLWIFSSFISSCEECNFHALQHGTIKCVRTVHFLVTRSYLLSLRGVPRIAK